MYLIAKYNALEKNASLFFWPWILIFLWRRLFHLLSFKFIGPCWTSRAMKIPCCFFWLLRSWTMPSSVPDAPTRSCFVFATSLDNTWKRKHKIMVKITVSFNAIFHVVFIHGGYVSSVFTYFFTKKVTIWLECGIISRWIKWKGP